MELVSQINKTTWTDRKELPYVLEKKLRKKLDVMIKRCKQDEPKQDAWMIVHGAEGDGKTNSSIAIAGYAKLVLRRPIHLFFRLEPLINFAKSTEKKIIIWDEPSLDSLSSEQLKELNRNLLRLAMTVRKKRHVFLINFTKFWKFSEYITVDRALCLIHMYNRRGIEPGRFRFVRKHKLEELWNNYTKRKKRTYGASSSFGGRFTEIMSKYFDEMDITVNGIQHATLKDYEEQKDIAINSIGTKEMSKFEIELNNLRRKLGNLELPVKTYLELAKQIKTNDRTIRKWREIPIYKPKTQEIEVSYSVNRTNITNSGSDDNEIPDDLAELDEKDLFEEEIAQLEEEEEL